MPEMASESNGSLYLSMTASDGDTFKDEATSCAAKTRKFVGNKLPILQWLPEYKKSYILSDLLAGITVWLTAVPQSMAYAGIAGLTPEYGLYSNFVGPFLYILLGNCRQVTIGPTAVVELLTYQTCGDNFADCVVLMGFYCGVIELFFGILHLGFIISFISEPVTVGFTAGAALTIASSQVKSILGLTGKSTGRDFMASWEFIFKYIGTIQLGDSILGFVCVFFLISLQKLKDVNPPASSTNAARWKKLFRFLSLARNALAIFLSAVVAVAWSNPPFALTGTVRSGFPPVEPPAFELYDPHSNSTMNFTETLNFLSTGPLVVAFIAILQNVAISKAFGSGQTIDGTQEMIALGATNIIGGFFSCMPTSGSFTRSAVNEASGVKSQLSGIFVGILILLSLGVLTPTFQYIPKASLAAVIISAMIFMIEFETIFQIFRASSERFPLLELDFLCCIVTFASSLILGMEYGILVGVALSTLIILLRSLRPSVTLEFGRDSDTRLKYLLLKPDQGIYFPSVDFIRDTVNKLVRRHRNHKIIVIQCDKWTRSDFTAANSLIALAKSLEKSRRTLILYKQSSAWTEAFSTLGSQKPDCCRTSKELCDLFKIMNEDEDSKPLVSVESHSLDDSESNTTHSQLEAYE